MRGFCFKKKKKKQKNTKAAKKNEIATVHKNSDNHHVWAHFQYNKFNEWLRVYWVFRLLGWSYSGASIPNRTDRLTENRLNAFSFSRILDYLLVTEFKLKLERMNLRMCVILRVCEFFFFSLSPLSSCLACNFALPFFSFCHVFRSAFVCFFFWHDIRTELDMYIRQ